MNNTELLVNYCHENGLELEGYCSMSAEDTYFEYFVKVGQEEAFARDLHAARARNAAYEKILHKLKISST